MTFAMGGAPAPCSDRIPVELFQILKDDAVESAALNMQYAGSRQFLPEESPWTEEPSGLQSIGSQRVRHD